MRIANSMKYFSILFFIASLFFSLDVKAQSDSVYVSVSEPPQFIGDYIKLLRKNLRYPQDAAKERIEGKVFLRFIIEKDGAITDMVVVKGVCPSLDEEAIRVIKLSSGNWVPAKNQGVIVRCRKNLFVDFKLSK